jgi:hypothetical protein
MRTLVLFGVFGSLIACSEEDPPSQYAESTLEQATVVPDEPLEGPRRDSGGSLTGDPEGADMRLTVGSSTAEVHAPSFPDLTPFDGTGAFMSIVEVAPSGEASLLLRDDYDNVVYLLETIEPDVLTAEAFGGNFISLGNDLGVTPAYQSELRIYSAFVQTDNGEIELFPGEPQEILVGGASYRVAVTAAWHRELDPTASFNCAIREDVLAYDVLRVEPGTADTTPLVRDALFPIEQGTCGLQPPPS